MAKVIMINTKTRTIRVENADKNIDWITVKGTHVPIEKGQSKSAAVKSFVEKKRPETKKENPNSRAIEEDENVMPGVLQYSKYLDTIESRTGMSRDEARKKYGQYTIKQWKELLSSKEKQQSPKKERNWQRGRGESEDAYFDRREKTMAEARKIDKVSDWYKKAYKGDDDGLPKNKDLTFDELADGLLSGKITDFYETVGTGESDVREKIFQELSERTGRPYDDFYDAWLHGGSKGTESRKKKQAESAAWMDKLLELHTDMDPELRKAIVAARDRAKKDS